MLTSIGRDFRLALRALARRPLYALVTIVTLGIGMGVNTAMFSIVDAAIIRDLPFREPDRLMELSLSIQPPNEALQDHVVWSYPKFVALRDAQRSFSGLAAYAGENVNLSGRALSTARFGAFLLAVFGGVALALAAVGIYGVVAYSVAQRRREIGIRLALGARRRRVLRLVVGQMLSLTGIGIVLGLAGAILAAQALGTLLFNTSPLDPVTYISLAVALASVAALASFLPARSASRLDPVTVLRVE